MGPDTDNGRVTLAIVQNDVKHLSDQVQSLRDEIREAMSQVRAQVEQNKNDITILTQTCLRINAIKISGIIGAVVVVIGVAFKLAGLW